MVCAQESELISCLINTKNSEIYIQEVLNSLRWATEIVVVDMHSSDRTREIAKKNGAKCFLFDDVGYVEPARAFGVSQCTQPWILIVDSDEIIPRKLAQFLIGISKENTFDVVYVSFRNFFFGYELKGSGWSYKDIRVPRFFRKESILFTSEIHKGFVIDKKSRIYDKPEFETSILHFNYHSVKHFIDKLNNYTDHEAKKELRDFGGIWVQMLYQTMREIGGRFIIKKGYLDGWLGFYLATAMAFYRTTSIAKKTLPSQTEVQNQYKRLSNSTETLGKNEN